MRIWPVYFIGFAITFLSLQFYALFSTGEWIFSLRDYWLQCSLLGDWFGIGGIDGISWTLQIEIKFYAFFFLLYILHWENSPKIIAGFAVTTALLSVLYSANTGALLAIGQNFFLVCHIIIDALMYIIYILMGYAIYWLYAAKWDRKVWLAVEEVLLISFVISVHSLQPDYVLSVLLNYFLAYLIFLNVYMVRDKITQGRVLKFLADNSFSIFILHGVNGYILLTIFYDMGIPMYISLPIVIAIVLFVSWLFHRYVEEPIGRLAKKYIIARFE